MKFNKIYEGLLHGKKYRLDYWITSQYIYFDDDTSTIRSEDGDEYKLNSTQIMLSDTWEEYIEPIDYSKYIGCLCWFWDDLEEEKTIGILEYISNDNFPYNCIANLSYKHCRPVKPEEIKFYKEKE